MHIKTGTDIIEIDRIRESIESTDGKFCERVYTKKEIEHYVYFQEQFFEYEIEMMIPHF